LLCYRLGTDCGKHTFVVLLDGATVVTILEEFVTGQLEVVGLSRRSVGAVGRRGRAPFLGAVHPVLLLSLLRIDVHGASLVVSGCRHGRQSTAQLVGGEIKWVGFFLF
jgi:hypothetical protein